MIHKAIMKAINVKAPNTIESFITVVPFTRPYNSLKMYGLSLPLTGGISHLNFKFWSFSRKQVLRKSSAGSLYCNKT